MNLIAHLQFDESIPLRIQKAVQNVFVNFASFCRFHHVAIPDKEITIGIGAGEHTLHISPKFISLLTEGVFNHEAWFENAPLLIDQGRKDYVGTCFYMINCLQEWGTDQTDKWGRFPYVASYQNKFDCVEDNLVAQYFEEIARILGITDSFNRQSSYHFSHDIDLIYEGWKQNTVFYLKRGNVIGAAKCLLDRLLKKHYWQNIEDILKLAYEHGTNNQFFWLVKQGSSEDGMFPNADYSIQDKYVVSMMKRIEQSVAHRNGLHKSISNDSFEAELKRFPTSTTPKINRYHYLKFHPKKDFRVLDKSPIEKDYSLGFAERIGFRNSYGLPFKPYDIANDVSFNFTEYPLHIMDSTFQFYHNLNAQEIENKVKQFIDKNNTSAQIQILWHNNSYGQMKYKPYRKLIETILQYVS